MPTHTVTLPDYSALGVAIKNALGAKYSAAHEAGTGVYVVFDDGRSLFIHALWNDKSRLAVSCCWPKQRNGGSTFPGTWDTKGKTTEITVGATRSAKQIAKEIQRRLLPDYNELFAVLQNRVANENSFADAVKANVERLAAVAQVPNPPCSNNRPGHQPEDLSLYHSTNPLLKGNLGTVSLSDTTAEFRNLRVSLSRAEAIIKLLMTPE